MSAISRRNWIGLTAAGLIGVRRGWSAKFTRPLGVQLYTVRNVLPSAAEPTLRAIGAIGYREVEIALADVPRLAPMLKENRLKPVSCHIDTAIVTGSSQGKPAAMTLAAAIEQVKKFGIQYVVMPYLRPEDRGSGDFYQKLTDQMNRAAEQCRAAGLQFCYHNHAFEFKGAKGQRPIDILLERLDPKNVGLEMDVFWVSVAGNDPVEMLNQNKGRVPLLHLKDKQRGAPTQYEEKLKPEVFKEVGSGSLDFPAILRAAAAAGVKHYFVEQDQTPGDPVASLKQSYEYLRGLTI